jgi:hypothetical protein
MAALRLVGGVSFGVTFTLGLFATVLCLTPFWFEGVFIHFGYFIFCSKDITDCASWTEPSKNTSTPPLNTSFTFIFSPTDEFGPCCNSVWWHIRNDLLCPALHLGLSMSSLSHDEGGHHRSVRLLSHPR